MKNNITKFWSPLQHIKINGMENTIKNVAQWTTNVLICFAFSLSDTSTLSIMASIFFFARSNL